MHYVYLQDATIRELPLSGSIEKIAIGLLELAGVSQVCEFPDGRRIFTVKRLPPDVPMAGIFWKEYEPIRFEGGGVLNG